MIDDLIDDFCVSVHSTENSTNTTHWSKETKTWIEAQSYCREHHTDLVSGDQVDGLAVNEDTKDDIKWWLGLFRDAWVWSDESNSSFRHWESFQSGQEQHRCAFLKRSGKWDSGDCSESRSFFCYEGESTKISLCCLTSDGCFCSTLFSKCN